MKKQQNLMLILLALSCYGCCITKPDCDPAGGNFTYGPELSYRTSSYWGKDAKEDDYKHIGSIGFGAYAHWVFCEDYPNMGLYSGLFYNQFGAKTEYDDGGENTRITDRLSYLTVPFTFTYYVISGVRAEIGPDISFLLNAKEIYKYGGDKETENFSEDVSNVQIGFNIGVSYTHEETGLGGFVRYNGGFTSVPSSDYDYKAYNGGISLGVRYRLNNLLYGGGN